MVSDRYNKVLAIMHIFMYNISIRDKRYCSGKYKTIYQQISEKRTDSCQDAGYMDHRRCA